MMIIAKGRYERLIGCSKSNKYQEVTHSAALSMSMAV